MVALGGSVYVDSDTISVARRIRISHALNVPAATKISRSDAAYAAEIVLHLPAPLRAALRIGALSYHEKDVLGDLGIGEWSESGAWLMSKPSRTSISLDYGTPGSLAACTITGDVFYAGGDLVLVEARDPGNLTGYAAAGALRSAVRDGRIKLPDSIRAAIDNGARVL
jgi:hypothetical protein